MSKYWQQSRTNPLNKSVSKFGYGFDKAPRFRSSSKISCDSFYKISTEISGKDKGVGLGRGSKITFGDKNQYPSPCAYKLKSDFSDSKKGYNLRLGRQSIKYGGIFDKSITPDPARYNLTPDSSQKNTKRGYTMRSKLKPLQPSYKKAPGPGQYKQSSTISATGIYTLSTISNCATPKIKYTKTYDPSSKLKTPSPFQYNLDKQNLNTRGSFYNSKYHGSRCRSFSKQPKNEDVKLKMLRKVPGPGAYEHFSQFGAKERSGIVS